MHKQLFGTLPDGREAYLYTLTNDRGLTAKICTYGGTLVSLEVPDRYGNKTDVVWGFDEFESYLGDHPKFGTLVGRYANRIALGTFSLAGEEYSLAKTDPPHHLHGGVEGFDKKLWEASDVSQHGEDRLKLSYQSPDGEEGFPGNLQVEVIFSLKNSNALHIDYHALTDAPTIVNLTHHGYFNLKGEGDINEHEVQIFAKRYLPGDETGLPTGEIASVVGTPFDFQHAHRLGDRLQEAHPQVVARKGFDHNYVLDHWDGREQFVARVYEPESGRIMEVRTTQPGMQLYTANFMEETVGKRGQVYRAYGAFCMETQHFPDSPNQPEFPSTVLQPGDAYHHSVSYQFS